MTVCPICGGTDVEYSDARGETSCTSCGAVLEEGRMVESVSFGESSSGAAHVVGQFVSFASGFASSFNARESREQILQRGYNHIQHISSQLGIPSVVSEAAQRVFLLAVQRNFTTGRAGRQVAAACLYTICRREKSPQMLIDFSDVLRVPVRTLGQIFMKLLRTLHLSVPHIDPSLFMERFASKMDFGDKTQMVATTGVRLIQAMTRDWICTGRRPTGLCGAALLISARYHNFKINAEDVVEIVRISSSTVMKRLYEFRDTSTAALTAEEFENSDLSTLPILYGPPCWERSRRKEEQMKNRLPLSNEEERCGDEDEEERCGDEEERCGDEEKRCGDEEKRCEDEEGALTTQMQDINVETERTNDCRVTSKGAVEPRDECNGGEFDETLRVESVEEKPQMNECEENTDKVGCRLGLQLNVPEDQLCAEVPTASDIVDIAREMIGAIDRIPLEEKSFEKGLPDTQSTCAETPCAVSDEKSVHFDPSVFADAESDPPVGEEEDVEDDDPLAALLRHVRGMKDTLIVETDCDNNTTRSPETLTSTVASTRKESEHPSSSTANPLEVFPQFSLDTLWEETVGEERPHPGGDDQLANLPGTGEIETLSDISESEIEHYLLNEEEKAAKALIWDELTKEVMPEVHRRLREKRRKEEMSTSSTSRRKRKKEVEAYPEAASASDSVRMALDRHAISGSKRLQTDALDSLFTSL